MPTSGGNSITGVELVRRISGGEAHVWTGPLIVNKTTGVKFGKSEAGAIWLDPAKTTPTQFYQFWINCDDAGVEDYLKIYTLLTKAEIEAIMAAQLSDPGSRAAQTHLATEVTKLVHGEEATEKAQMITDVLTGKLPVGEADSVMEELKTEIPALSCNAGESIIEALVMSQLASSNSEARRLLQGNGVSLKWSESHTRYF